MTPQPIRDFITSRGLTVLGYVETANGKCKKIGVVTCGGSTDWMDFLKKLSGSGTSATGWTVQMPQAKPEHEPEHFWKSGSEAALGYKAEFLED